MSIFGVFGLGGLTGLTTSRYQEALLRAQQMQNTQALDPYGNLARGLMSREVDRGVLKTIDGECTEISSVKMIEHKPSDFECEVSAVPCRDE